MQTFKFISIQFYIILQELLDQSTTPEMLRAPLENVVLKTKLLDMGPPRQILALAIDPPNLSDIDNTILLLKELGGLLPTVEGVATPHDGDLTFIGRVMSNLPVDVRIGRLLVFGHCFSVLDECIIIGKTMHVDYILYHN